MPTYFFDTSALVKRYHEEPGTERVDVMLEDEASEVVISSLAVVESVSAFRRKYNRDEVSRDEMEQLVATFFREALDGFVILPMAESLIRFSFDLVLDNDLRTLDSLQLSSGLAVAQEVDDVRFVTADEALASAGEQRGLETIVPR